MNSETAQSSETVQLKGKELAEKLGCAPSTLSTAAREGYLVNDRWEVQEWAVRSSSGRLKYYEVPSDRDFLTDDSGTEGQTEADASASPVDQDVQENETPGSDSPQVANSLPNESHSKQEDSESPKITSTDQSNRKKESHAEEAQKPSPMAIPSASATGMFNLPSSRMGETDSASPKIRISDPKLLAKTRNALSVSPGALRRASMSLSSSTEKQSAPEQRGLPKEQGNARSQPQAPTTNVNLEGTSRNLSIAYLGGEAIRHETAGARLLLTGASAALGGAGTYWATGNRWGSVFGAVLSGVAGYLIFEQPWVGNPHQRRSQHR